MPLFNEHKQLPETISLLSQAGADELIFVDGGSTDGSQDLLQESGLHWVATEAGRARQMNAGSSLCKSDIILFVHVDTVICSSHISAVKQAMSDSEYAGGRFDVSLSGKHPAFRIIERLINMRSRMSRISTGDQCQFVRRSVFDALGGFPDLPLMEDVAFSRLLKREGKLACLKERVITSSRRWEQHGIMRTVLMMWKMRLLYWLGIPADRLALMYRDAR